MSQSSNNKKQETAISEDQVAQYLKNHPGFFLHRDDLLLELELTHASGDAVSLLERQVSLLRERNMDMRNRLNNLLDNARHNDALFEKTKGLILSLLEAKDLDKLAATFNQGMLREFAMDHANLILFGDPQALTVSHCDVVSLDQAYQAIPALLKSDKATCGVLREEENAFLFSDVANSDIGSAAVMPLSFGHHLGVLTIASRDPHYFRSGMGTLFLSYIGEVMNRILPSLMEHGE